MQSALNLNQTSIVFNAKELEKLIAQFNTNLPLAQQLANSTLESKEEVESQEQLHQNFKTSKQSLITLSEHLKTAFINDIQKNPKQKPANLLSALKNLILLDCLTENYFVINTLLDNVYAVLLNIPNINCDRNILTDKQLAVIADASYFAIGQLSQHLKKLDNVAYQKMSAEEKSAMIWPQTLDFATQHHLVETYSLYETQTIMLQALIFSLQSQLFSLYPTSTPRRDLIAFFIASLQQLPSLNGLGGDFHKTEINKWCERVAGIYKDNLAITESCLVLKAMLTSEVNVIGRALFNFDKFKKSILAAIDPSQPEYQLIATLHIKIQHYYYDIATSQQIHSMNAAIREILLDQAAIYIKLHLYLFEACEKRDFLQPEMLNSISLLALSFPEILESFHSPQHAVWLPLEYVMYAALNQSLKRPAFQSLGKFIDKYIESVNDNSPEKYKTLSDHLSMMFNTYVHATTAIEKDWANKNDDVGYGNHHVAYATYYGMKYLCKLGIRIGDKSLATYEYMYLYSSFFVYKHMDLMCVSQQENSDNIDEFLKICDEYDAIQRKTLYSLIKITHPYAKFSVDIYERGYATAIKNKMRLTDLANFQAEHKSFQEKILLKHKELNKKDLSSYDQFLTLTIEGLDILEKANKSNTTLFTFYFTLLTDTLNCLDDNKELHQNTDKTTVKEIIKKYAAIALTHAHKSRKTYKNMGSPSHLQLFSLYNMLAKQDVLGNVDDMLQSYIYLKQIFAESSVKEDVQIIIRNNLLQNMNLFFAELLSKIETSSQDIFAQYEIVFDKVSQLYQEIKKLPRINTHASSTYASLPIVISQLKTHCLTTTAETERSYAAVKLAFQQYKAFEKTEKQRKIKEEQKYREEKNRLRVLERMKQEEQRKHLKNEKHTLIEETTSNTATPPSASLNVPQTQNVKQPHKKHTSRKNKAKEKSKDRMKQNLIAKTANKTAVKNEILSPSLSPHIEETIEKDEDLAKVKAQDSLIEIPITSSAPSPSAATQIFVMNENPLEHYLEADVVIDNEETKEMSVEESLRAVEEQNDPNIASSCEHISSNIIVPEFRQEVSRERLTEELLVMPPILGCIFPNDNLAYFDHLSMYFDLVLVGSSLTQLLQEIAKAKYQSIPAISHEISDVDFYIPYSEQKTPAAINYFSHPANGWQIDFANQRHINYSKVMNDRKYEITVRLKDYTLSRKLMRLSSLEMRFVSSEEISKNCYNNQKHYIRISKQRAIEIYDQHNRALTCIKKGKLEFDELDLTSETTESLSNVSALYVRIIKEIRLGMKKLNFKMKNNQYPLGPNLKRMLGFKWSYEYFSIQSHYNGLQEIAALIKQNYLSAQLLMDVVKAFLYQQLLITIAKYLNLKQRATITKVYLDKIYLEFIAAFSQPKYHQGKIPAYLIVTDISKFVNAFFSKNKLEMRGIETQIKQPEVEKARNYLSAGLFAPMTKVAPQNASVNQIQSIHSKPSMTKVKTVAGKPVKANRPFFAEQQQKIEAKVETQNKSVASIDGKPMRVLSAKK